MNNIKLNKRLLIKLLLSTMKASEKRIIPRIVKERKLEVLFFQN